MILKQLLILQSVNAGTEVVSTDPEQSLSLFLPHSRTKQTHSAAEIEARDHMHMNRLVYTE